MKVGGRTSQLTGVLLLAVGGVLLLDIVRDQWKNATANPWIRELRGGTDEERREAALELGIMALRGERPASAIPVLIEHLDDPDKEVRLLSAQALKSFNLKDEPTVIPALARVLAHGDSDLRVRAAEVLGSTASPTAVDPLIEALTSDPESAVRAGAAIALGWLARDAAAAVPALILRRNREEAPLVRRSIIVSLNLIDPASEPVVMDTISALRDRNREVRRTAASYLKKSADHSVVMALRDVLRAEDEDEAVCREAAASLGRIGLGDPGTIPALCEALKTPRSWSAAVQALRDIRDVRSKWPASDEPSLPATMEAAVPALQEVMEHDDPGTRGVVVSLLWRMVSRYEHAPRAVYNTLSAAVPRLVARLKSEPDLGARNESLSVFMHEEDVAPEALLPFVFEVLSAQETWSRHNAVVVLRNLGRRRYPSGRVSGRALSVVVPALAKALHDQAPAVREEAVTALAEFGKGAEDALPELQEMMRREELPRIRTKLVEALRRISAETERVNSSKPST